MKDILKATAKAAKKFKVKQDLVRWTATTPDGKPVNANWATTNCYAQALSYEPGRLEIRCLPYDGPTPEQLPAWWYHYFFRLLKQHGLVPPEVKILHRKGANCMIIPATGWDRHSIYIALCYYRQMDIYPQEVMQALLLYRQLAPQGTNFFQCLHWLAAITKVDTGHYFMTFGAYGGGGVATDLSTGMALAWFAQQSREKRLELCPAKTANSAYDSRYTYTFLAKQAKLFPSLKVEDLGAILDPQYAPLYANPAMKPVAVPVAKPPDPVPIEELHEAEGE